MMQNQVQLFRDEEQNRQKRSPPTFKNSRFQIVYLHLTQETVRREKSA